MPLTFCFPLSAFFADLSAAVSALTTCPSTTFIFCLREAEVAEEEEWLVTEDLTPASPPRSRLDWLMEEREAFLLLFISPKSVLNLEAKLLLSKESTSTMSIEEEDLREDEETLDDEEEEDDDETFLEEDLEDSLTELEENSDILLMLQRKIMRGERREVEEGWYKNS
jgi:hypothetical protein